MEKTKWSKVLALNGILITAARNINVVKKYVMVYKIVLYSILLPQEVYEFNTFGGYPKLPI